MKDLQELVRKNIWELTPYSSARDEYKGKAAHTFLDANESPYNNPYDRYPDPLQWKLKQGLSLIKGVKPEQIFLGNGSDEAIDLVFRIFCEPGKDNVAAISPTYGMYEVCADINDVAYRPVLLDAHYQLNAKRLLEATDAHTKVIFLCSPNNPTGNCLDTKEMETVLREFQGIVVIDEAYADFSKHIPFRLRLEQFKNIIVLNTFSKAFSCAAIRLGMAFADTSIIELFNKVKYPYNVNQLTQEKGLEIVRQWRMVSDWVTRIMQECPRVMSAVADLPICEAVYPTEANFFLAKFRDANDIYHYLINEGIVVRNRSHIALCGDCLRITIGTPTENRTLLSALRKYTVH